MKDISASLMLNNEELKGDIFFRFYQLCALCRKNSSIRLSTIFTVYYRAINYYKDKDDPEYFYRIPLCAAKAVIIKSVHQESSDWRVVIDHLSAQGLKYACALVMRNGNINLFHLMAGDLFRRNSKTDVEIKSEAALEWIDETLENKDYNFFLTCFYNLPPEHQYEYCFNKLSDLLSKEPDSEATLLFTQLHNSLDPRIISSLADGLFNKGEFDKFIQLTSRYFNIEKDIKHKSDTAKKWCKAAVQLHKPSFLAACIKNMLDKDEFIADIS